jgi:putative polyhydroxyalkanoate system protein
MSDIHIHREHQLSLSQAREVARQWTAQAETDFGMRCTYTEGDESDEMQFARSGVRGMLRVSNQDFELNAQLGFVLSAFKDRIESEIEKNLDRLLATKTG